MLFALLALLTAAFAAGCGEETEEPHINIGDMESGAGVTSAADLAAFFESGGEIPKLPLQIAVENHRHRQKAYQMIAKIHRRAAPRGSNAADKAGQHQHLDGQPAPAEGHFPLCHASNIFLS